MSPDEGTTACELSPNTERIQIMEENDEYEVGTKVMK